MSQLEVDRRDALSVPVFRREYLSARRPVVIAGALDGWPALARWSFAFLGGDAGDVPVKVMVAGRRAFGTTLAEYVRAIAEVPWSEQPYYLKSASIFEARPDLLADFAAPAYFRDGFRLLPPGMRPSFRWVYVSPAGARTPLHVDPWGTHAWLAQLAGRKQWRFLSPEQETFECVVGPGDLVFAPGGWAHEVTSVDPSISITTNFMGRGCVRSCLGALAAWYLHRARERLSGSRRRSGPAGAPDLRYRRTRSAVSVAEGVVRIAERDTEIDIDPELAPFFGWLAMRTGVLTRSELHAMADVRAGIRSSSGADQVIAVLVEAGLLEPEGAA